MRSFDSAGNPDPLSSFLAIARAFHLVPAPDFIDVVKLQFQSIGALDDHTLPELESALPYPKALIQAACELVLRKSRDAELHRAAHTAYVFLERYLPDAELVPVMTEIQTISAFRGSLRKASQLGSRPMAEAVKLFPVEEELALRSLRRRVRRAIDARSVDLEGRFPGGTSPELLVFTWRSGHARDVLNTARHAADLLAQRVFAPLANSIINCRTLQELHGASLTERDDQLTNTLVHGLVPEIGDLLQEADNPPFRDSDPEREKVYRDTAGGLFISLAGYAASTTREAFERRRADFAIYLSLFEGTSPKATG